jgi:hypothetical protein
MCLWYYTSWINKSQSACPPREAELGRAWQLFPKMRITPTTMITTWKGNNNVNGQRPRRLIFTDDLTRPLFIERDISTMTGQRRYMSPFFHHGRLLYICAAFRWIHIGKKEPAHKWCGPILLDLPSSSIDLDVFTLVKQKANCWKLSKSSLLLMSMFIFFWFPHPYWYAQHGQVSGLVADSTWHSWERLRVLTRGSVFVGGYLLTCNQIWRLAVYLNPRPHYIILSHLSTVLYSAMQGVVLSVKRSSFDIGRLLLLYTSSILSLSKFAKCKFLPAIWHTIPSQCVNRRKILSSLSVCIAVNQHKGETKRKSKHKNCRHLGELPRSNK